MASLPIVILAVLTVCGAGLVPGVALPAAAALLAAACLRPLPSDRVFRAGVWVWAGAVTWALLSVFPLGAAAGPWRLSLWADIGEFVARYGSLCGIPAGSGPVARLSLHPGGTLRWVILVLGAGGMYALVASLRRNQRVFLARALVLLGGLTALAGLAGRYLVRREGCLMWWYPVAEIGGGEPLGPFVNRNHFAAFCGLLVPVAAVLALDPPARWRTACLPCGWEGEDDAVGGALPVRLLAWGSLLALIGGILGSLSRGGVAALLAGLLIVALLWLRRGPVAASLAALAALGGMVLVALWPDTGLQQRLHELRDTVAALGARGPVWADALRLWTRVPVCGCGFNAFAMVFPRVTAWATVTQASHAESDLLQTLAEGGIAGSGLAGGLVALWCLPVLRGLRGSGAGSRPGMPGTLLSGVAGGLAAVAIQGCVDIPLRIPLCAWTAAAVAGLGAPLPGREPAARLWPERLALALLLAGLLTIGWREPGWETLYRDRDAWLAQADTHGIAAMLCETPSYWQAWCELSRRLCSQGLRTRGAERESLEAAGLDALRAAVRCNPRNPELRGVLAASLWGAGLRAEAREHRDAQLALLPGDRRVREHWLRTEWQDGETEECRLLAFRLAEEAPEAPAGAGYLLWLADRELAEGSVTRAREALLAVLEKRPADPNVLAALARCEARLGNADQEAEWLRRLAAAGKAGAAAWWRLAEIARAQRDRTALHEALGRAVQLDPSRRRAADQIWKAYIESQAAGEAEQAAPR